MNFQYVTYQAPFISRAPRLVAVPVEEPMESCVSRPYYEVQVWRGRLKTPAATARCARLLSADEYAAILRNPALPAIKFTTLRRPSPGDIWVELRKRGQRRPEGVDGLAWERASGFSSAKNHSGDTTLRRCWCVHRTPDPFSPDTILRNEIWLDGEGEGANDGDVRTLLHYLPAHAALVSEGEEKAARERAARDECPAPHHLLPSGAIRNHDQKLLASQPLLFRKD